MSLIDELHRRVAEGSNASNLGFLVLLLSLVVAPRVAALARLPAAAGLVVFGIALGPHGVGLFASHEIALRALGELGLLYALFVAGMDLDLHRLARYKHAAIGFALASFLIPALLGFGSARLLHYGTAAAILLAAGWGSHTMVSLPLLRQLGLERHPAVATVVAATPGTSILVVGLLAAVSVTTVRGAFELVLGLCVVVGWSIGVLPRIAHWFFARVGSDTAQRFVFALAAMLVGAILAEAAGVPDVLGAFFAGLGLSRAIPAGSPLMERTVFVGGALFVPIFLVSVGTRIDLAMLASPRALGYVVLFTAIVLAGKLMAAFAIGSRAGFDRREIGIMWGLTTSQVATTLATIAIGERLGVLDSFTVHVVLAVVLVTVVISPAIAGACGRLLSADVVDDVAGLGERVLVPICDGASRPLLGIAGQLAERDMGLVVAGSFATGEVDPAQLRSRRAEAEDWLGRAGLEGRSLLRVSRSISAGVVQTVRGEAATLLVAESRPELREAVHDAPIPVVVVADAGDGWNRLVVLAPQASADLDLAREVTLRLAHGRPVVVVAPRDVELVTLPESIRISSSDPIGWSASHARPHDLFVVPGLASLDDVIARAPLAARHVLAAIAVRTSP